MSRTDEARINNIFNKYAGLTNEQKIAKGYPVLPTNVNVTDEDRERALSGDTTVYDEVLSRTDDARINNVFQNNPGGAAYEQMVNNSLAGDGTDLSSADPYDNLRKFRGPDGIDFEDKESVKELQGYLGVDQDGMFGPITEKAWRLAVGAMDRSDEKEVLKYDFNKQALNDRVEKSKLGLGGLLKQGYTNLDKKVFGGYLPWGHRRGLESQTADEYYGDVDRKVPLDEVEESE